ncbi:hypothetical protein OG369_00105 [Streptomyces sp. NBC_01221]|nr:MULTISPECIES: hypothetical protein [unclassified Streptomyces]WSP53310.1 hypothetical protein OG306_01915 [Streptomyces sp. NBC_01241]WSU26012.1 hypothetical protein OG508_37385 [Streptomyces sp. NBC_01108]MCX4784671.1 hypothetical protein [Streptomyces sp. NBC_01221]MCX4799366.1 hypothetical protein [Streptomyces sp. NBC_01242]WSJ40539.1 hypothetical protein OG772_34345 [Streptomyces sp. NBC_01321]
MQIDSTRLDVMAVLDDEVVARSELTIAVDVPPLRPHIRHP